VWPWIYRDGVPDGDGQYGQSCCWREPASETTDRCIWHADPSEVQKDAERLQSALSPPEVRSRAGPAEILDGANVPDVELGNAISFENVLLREANLSHAMLFSANFAEANLLGTDLPGAKLAGADFTDAILSKVDLTKAELDRAILEKANLEEADLSSARLYRADLSKANVEQADLAGANLNEVDLAEAYLGKANLTGASLWGADLSTASLPSADLSNASLTHADLSETNLSFVNAAGADLSDADLSEALVREADLSNADLTEADLSNATLRGADFTDADLTEADLSHADLRESVLDGAALAKATLREARLPSGDQLVTADLRESDLRGQDLRDAALAGAHLPKANLTDADLSGANLSEANLERALLNRTDLFDTRFAGARLEGAAFGDAQINEGMFRKLSPKTSTADGDHDLTDLLARIVLGPVGHTAHRCVYDPASQYDLSDAELDDSDPADPRADVRREHHGDSPEVRAGGVYRQFEQLAADNALPSWQRRFFILRQDMQTRQKTGVEYWFALLQRALFGYGESFGRVVGWSGSIVVVFAVVYLIGGWIRPVGAEGTLGRPLVWTRGLEEPTVIWESLYYSTLTFTALGFGDFRPVGAVGQLLTVLETASGALLVALLVFVLGRRAAR
jgi:uncharacterized protein YjbI with pentapeptide repeats